jgi:4,5-dihydroxyphthalate decarboxylase
MTASLWQRAILQHDFGVDPRDLEWWYGGEHTAHYEEKYPQRAPDGVSLNLIPADKSLVGMLDSGELDALVTASVPGPFRAGSPNIDRLFPDYVAVEREWFRRTGFFPIMHIVVLKRDVYEANQWCAVALLEAFCEAKRRALERMHYLGALAVALPWLSNSLDEVNDLFGGDPFAYGFQRNRAILEAMTQYSFEQGLTDRELRPEELFPPETLEHSGT